MPVDQLLPAWDQYPDAVGIHPERLTLFRVKDAPKDVDRKAVLGEFFAHPYSLAYYSLLSSDILEAQFPLIFDGYYLPAENPQPLAETEKLLKYFGAPDTDKLLSRTENLVRTVFQKEPLAGETVIQALDFMHQLHERLPYKMRFRKTGEEKIAHETRIILRVLTDAIIHRKNLDPFPTLYPKGHHPVDILSPQNLWVFAATLVGSALHDLKEDYILKNLASLRISKQDPRVIILSHLPQDFKDNSSTRGTVFPAEKFFQPTLLAFPTPEFTGMVSFLVDTFTKKEFDRRLFSADEEAAMYAEHMLIRLALIKGTVQPRHFIHWAVFEVKSCDRADNMMLWKHRHNPPYDSSYLSKLAETLYHFQIPSLFAWRTLHEEDLFLSEIDQSDAWDYWTRQVQDIPRAVPDALVKLLGAGDDDLFYWIVDPQSKCCQMMKRMNEAGIEFLVVPGISRADIFLPDGTHFEYFRNVISQH